MPPNAGMSGKAWTLRNVDPEARARVREEADRLGVSVAEYLTRALQRSMERAAAPEPGLPPANPRFIASEGEETPLPSVGMRLDKLERRIENAISGLDSTVHSLERSLFSVAERSDEVESLAQDTAHAAADALSEFQSSIEALDARLAQHTGDAETAQRDTLDQLQALIARTEEVAREAEAKTAILSEAQDTLALKMDDDFQTLTTHTRETLRAGLSDARTAAEEAAHAADLALNDALDTLRSRCEALEVRVSDFQSDLKERIDTGFAAHRAAEALLSERMSDAEEGLTAVERDLIEALVRSETNTTDAVRALREEARAAEADLTQRLEDVAQLASETSADLHEEFGAALSDLREGQTEVMARLEQEIAQRAIEVEVSARFARLERDADRSDIEHALVRLESAVADIAARPIDKVEEALVQRLETLAARLRLQEDQAAETEIVARSIEENLERLERSVSEVGFRGEESMRALQATIAELTERNSSAQIIPARFEERMEALEQSTAAFLGQARDEFASWAQSAKEAIAAQRLDETVAGIEQRLTFCEDKQAQTIDGLSIEVSRISAAIDTRLAQVEAFTETAGAKMISRDDELTRLIDLVEQRFETLTRSEGQASRRISGELTDMRHGIDERFAQIEERSVRAIERVCESVDMIGKRLSERQQEMVLDLVEKVSNDPRALLANARKR